ncbi:hypothetical protein QWZ08_15325 [Ferruginibacter paludis]|uniref:hypothetical protein n=1 Tax=Ferruginibacter paludis TaxID=1310417 RepID=UPI0025B4B9BA|nr:hypothetical protein [Ferruginibacter paludis]MDN3657019.1 hypothetical protein [Ferruginibacter paludis]
MKIKTIALLLWVFFYALQLAAQVQVREEPRHHPVLQNKYIRLLDVWLPPGDTTLFHIHATPSVFVILSNTITGTQIKDSAWSIAARSKAGTAWYRSFTPDPLVHRVCNSDTVVFHVNDIELLAPYNSTASGVQRLPFAVEFENEKAIAYRLTTTDFNQRVIKDRGPLIAELVSGSRIIFHNNTTNKTTRIEAGKYLYIKPATAFYFSASEKSNIEMILFEIK